MYFAKKNTRRSRRDREHFGVGRRDNKQSDQISIIPIAFLSLLIEFIPCNKLIAKMTTSPEGNEPTVNATVVTISYNDLVSFQEKQHEHDALIGKIGSAFGSDDDCLGILAVTDVPVFGEQRQALLPLAARLPTLPDLETCVDAEAFYSVGWSHGKEEIKPNTPDLNKGSFYANPLVDVHPKFEKEHNFPKWLYAPNVWPKKSLPSLEPALKTLGRTLFDTGVLLAGVCDAYCQKQLKAPFSAIQDSLRSSLNPKARLLHYFAPNDDASDEMWCAWHNDHVRRKITSDVGEAGFIASISFGAHSTCFLDLLYCRER